jgi:hypothetical protein
MLKLTNKHFLFPPDVRANSISRLPDEDVVSHITMLLIFHGADNDVLWLPRGFHIIFVTTAGGKPFIFNSQC